MSNFDGRTELIKGEEMCPEAPAPTNKRKKHWTQTDLGTLSSDAVILQSALKLFLFFHLPGKHHLDNLLCMNLNKWKVQMFR